MAYATFGTEPYMKVSLHTAPLLDSPCHGYALYRVLGVCHSQLCSVLLIPA
jgi:hypothetical protein